MMHPWDIALLTGDPVNVYILFWADRIFYRDGGKGVYIRDRNIVQYIYQLMEWIGKEWMKKVLSMLPYHKVDTLETLCKCHDLERVFQGTNFFILFKYNK